MAISDPIKACIAQAFTERVIDADTAIDMYFEARFEEVMLDSLSVHEFSILDTQHQALARHDEFTLYDPPAPDSRHSDLYDQEGDDGL